MFKNQFFQLFITTLFVVTLCSCISNQDKNETATKNIISEELHQEQCDLLAKANEELASINQKVRDLNDKIRDKGGKFTEEQNAALDNFDAKQISINKRMHEIKNIRQEQWSDFKASFEQDLAEIQTIIDGILESF